MKFQDDISNMNTYIHTDKPKPICPPLFQSWGHNELVDEIMIHHNLFIILLLGSKPISVLAIQTRLRQE